MLPFPSSSIVVHTKQENMPEIPCTEFVDSISICRPLLSDLHAKIAAVISTPQRHASLPDQLRMQPGIADVITVAKAAAQLRAAVFYAGVVIGTLHHIHTPDAVTGLQFFGAKPAAGPKTLRVDLTKTPGQGGKAPVCAAGRQAVCGSFSPAAPHSRSTPEKHPMGFGSAQ